MSEEMQQQAPQRAWYKQRIALFVGGSIIIAGVLVVVSMTLYLTSGAAQLDLSRPGYKFLQSQVDQTGSFEDFPASGSVNKSTIEDFQNLYQKQTKTVSGNGAFNPSALDDQTLGIDDPSGSE